MMNGRTDGTLRQPPRLWPGLLLAVVLVVSLAVPLILPQAAAYGMIGGAIAGLLAILWWLFFSRAQWAERLGAVGLIVVCLLVARRLIHPSIANGMMGLLYFFYGIPILSLALVAWAVASQRLPRPSRLATMVAAILMASGVMMLFRTGGINGDGGSDFHWRWTPSPEEQLLAQASGERTSSIEPPVIPPVPDKAPEPTKQEDPAASWPGFRGPLRDGVVRGLGVATDWSVSPPAELWRRAVGPAWSSFAIAGDLLYTQEQRGEDEMVSCYRLATGAPVWLHRNGARFWESNAGAGPRATPTVGAGRVYTLGATGILNALDARNGRVVWSRNAADDTKTRMPGWGFAASPLLVGDLVVVATGGTLAAYEAATGNPRWTGPKHSAGYSSPHLVTMGAIPQVLLLHGDGATSVAVADGKTLWEHTLPSGSRIVQPALIPGGDLLMNVGEFGDGNSMRRLTVAHQGADWSARERWNSTGLKPDFNDYVLHRGHAFGFDGSILACIDLADGKRKWKGGRYGHGQLVLLADQDLLLVLSEDGELALANATPEKFTELARFRALEGKTWNHPALVADVLVVRNGEEMAAFRLPLAAHRQGGAQKPKPM